ncbi:hypothetical protein MNEG_2711 [Monoraphidium neglectum]|uniref:AB hydrolase-1 domain-containing protein n=1 Tax=Monoraphidium neglectum TaxID=145388 RepID=A0A0D2MRM3_9CHLO|nr:hypothetical protein MNEG_2711 [Monoraphidium neglectum]KIZ05245.1 hypothetical protein MNEG_2711 [Monoraphidium neglectum]|eukprot:XP_013904264.1 hypothetical protein MNEG_2711 [Monoraphidium neglectum]
MLLAGAIHQRRQLAPGAKPIPGLHDAAASPGATADTVHVVTVDAPPTRAGCCGRSGAPRPPPCSGAAWRRCCCGFGSCVGWSSIFFLAVFGFFLALQAAWLAADQRAFLDQPPGRMLRVPVDGSEIQPQLHIQCVGPAPAPGQATFVFEAGGGAPGLAYAHIADALAAAGRRACWYDRLGYGWSGVAVRPTTLRRVPLALAALLDAAGEGGGGVILAGHSAGGDLSIQFAGLFPDRVSGLALMDAYSQAAIDLQSNFAFSGPGILGAIDAYRAATPFAWPRFGTGTAAVKQRIDPENGAALAALYGSNKEWEAQYVDFSATMSHPTITDDLVALSGRPAFWPDASAAAPRGPIAGWPSLGAKPLLLMPASETLAPGERGGGAALPCAAGELVANASCQAAVLASPGLWYAKLYLSYLSTLSSNATLAVMEGGHDFPWVDAQRTAAALIAKFAGV